MQCFICDRQATETPAFQGGHLVNCPSCGWYGITGTALHLLNQNCYVFNPARTKDWFEAQRERGVEHPLIIAENNLWD
jgi:hypothetical protein